MFFKNLQVYRFTRPLEQDIDTLERNLEEFKFKPCGSQDISKLGWVFPMGKSGSMYTHIAGKQILICLKKEEKMLPAGVIKDQLNERVEAIELEQGRALKKKEKDSLKEEIVMQLLPRAFSRTSQTFAWIDSESDMLYVDASSTRKAEELISLLRKTLGSLPIVPIQLKNQADVIMTDWLTEGNIPANFALEDEAELCSALEGGGIIRCKQQDLLSDEIKNHLSADKFVTKLALCWADSISFIIGEEFALKRIKFADVLQEQNEDIDKDDFAARFDADFALMTGEIKQLIPAVLAAFGGEQSL
ncbi:putative exonuclease, RdgC [Psychromonas ingrahamii 37]|uniref:Recombination-associated protein RdgC n=1 Tax=Psychromonas ingrahamii (strain DSM 17664 / CCUG 51855 / 37) TaxID=357804 RepID=RDGC_PSYIN|nr:recombination-associated protein RdgC [Psychromonas ingrahamii]A1SWV9.1 RecName: Full=Recombination-associated protein RdgC [Psychromonas ingrahamii 37]ABM03974.1 putative exonuclease, RdgC [Psychromonas ingrahamii 37]